MTRLFFILALFLPGICQAVQIQGREHLGLHEVAGKLGMKTRWIERDKVMQLESDWTRMRFEFDKRSISINGTAIYMGYPVLARRGRFYISESDFNHHIRPILTPQLTGGVPGWQHIVLDPGHGGKDPGAENDALKLREKALTLDLAKRVSAKLREQGFQVTLTRETDTFIPLEERAKKANALHADMFISLHFNASAKSTVAGVETYAFTPMMEPSTSRSTLHASDRKSYSGNTNDGWNTLAAYYIQRSLVDKLEATDRGLKRARFTVLRDIEMPGVLIEGGFVSNNREGKNIGWNVYRDKLAEAIVDGILVYRKTLVRLAG